MVRGNSEQEVEAVARAGLRPGQRVLVLGHGPGVGVALAAAAVGASGHVVGVDPSSAMTTMATRRCRSEIAQGRVQLAPGTAEDTGFTAASADVVISVNNVMLWDRAAGFAEVRRVLVPGGRLALSVHRHVLGITGEQLREEAAAAGFTQLELTVRPRRFNSPAIQLSARNPSVDR